MQIYINRIQIHSTYYLPVYCHIQTCTVVTMFLRYLVVCCVDWGVQDKNMNTMMIPTLYSLRTMGYQVNPVGTYWLLEDMVEQVAVGAMLYMCTPICVSHRHFRDKPWIIDSYH